MKEVEQVRRDYVDENGDELPVPEYLLGQLMYGAGPFATASMQSRERSLKLYFDLTVPQREEKTKVDAPNGPAIFLPERRPDPGKVVAIATKAKDDDAKEDAA